MNDLSKDLKALGKGDTEYSYDKPDPTVLERFPHPINRPDRDHAKGPHLTINITVSEFTSLCPKTGQPDFATIVIDYEPDNWCVESKSLKLYLMGFRNHGEFHESCVARIAHDLVNILAPKSIKVQGQFTPRGGIPFWPTVTWKK